MKAANGPPYSLGEDMTINPTSTRRIVVIDIQTTVPNRAQPSPAAPAGTEVATYIQLIADDGMQVTGAIFSDAPERDLLRGFWDAVRPGDVFYGYRVVDRLALLRQRTWALDLVPSRDLDLRTVYGHDTVDTAILRSSTGGAGYRSAQVLASVLGLRTRTSKPRERPLRDAR
jgi:hypothetical protein